MTRDELQSDIRIMEALDSVLGAIEEVAGVEFEPGERKELDVLLSDRTLGKRPIAASHAIPHDVALAGLRAMQGMLEQRLVKEAA